MQINGISHIHAAQAINQPHRAGAAQNAGAPASSRGVDQLDLSPAASFISQVREVPDIRQDRVDSIRAAIANGDYETDDKIDMALENLLAEIG
ncbi:flagellar biosynthesis anti-sigma factor FlgM [Lignipirellula cremea]|uniref:Negative regulator of flagellin synthesis n=1 Tax=Lignipirellula cremea TaxID=2528010 RepID=A0A518E4Z9_9BACT|nr:flagellar biosynthesis anti-sigma factor FlgM [Lignipirellula cremea]QDU99154.1 Anti-sigma-28 factor, FlgM [Lignipirellula cremea]